MLLGTGFESTTNDTSYAGRHLEIESELHANQTVAFELVDKANGRACLLRRVQVHARETLDTMAL